MGWTGTYTHWNSKENNRDIFLRIYPNYVKHIGEEGWKISQKGSDLYILYETKNHKWWIEKVYCRKRKSEFLTKEIDAITNDCFDFPKEWLDKLDPTDEEVIRYVTVRTLNESLNKQKNKENQTFNIGDVVLCKSDYAIHWNNYSIKENEDFIVMIKKNPNTKRNSKLYVIVKKDINRDNKEIFFTCPYRIKQATFNACKYRHKIKADIKSPFGF